MTDGGIISVTCLETLALKPVQTLRMHHLYSTRSRSLSLLKMQGSTSSNTLGALCVSASYKDGTLPDDRLFRPSSHLCQCTCKSSLTHW